MEGEITRQKTEPTWDFCQFSNHNFRWVSILDQHTSFSATEADIRFMIPGDVDVRTTMWGQSGILLSDLKGRHQVSGSFWMRYAPVSILAISPERFSRA